VKLWCFGDVICSRASQNTAMRWFLEMTAWDTSPQDIIKGTTIAFTDSIEGSRMRAATALVLRCNLETLPYDYSDDVLQPLAGTPGILREYAQVDTAHLDDRWLPELAEDYDIALP